MSTTPHQSPARCEGCNHLYRIPDPSHTYRCKACGGIVRVLSGDSDTSLAELDTAARFEANEALRDGYGWMSAVTWLFRLGALAYGFVTVLAVLALADSQVPVLPGITVIALSTLLTVMMVIGALQIDFKPFIWTTIVAVLATLVSIVHLLGPNPMGLALYWSAGWAAFFWAALLPTWRFRQLIAEHTDLYILHHASRSTRHAVETHPKEKHERLQQAMRSAAGKAWKTSAVVGAAIALASLGGSYMVYANLRPQELPEALASFEKAWNMGDLAAVHGHFSPRVRKHQTERLENVLRGHGWEKPRPYLKDRTTREEEDLVWVDYDDGDLTLRTSWTVEGRAWALASVELPTPPLEPVLETFREAWRSSDVTGLVSFFTEKSRERMRESIEGAVERRGWTPLPEILGSETSAGEEGVIVLTLTLAAGQVPTRWALRPDGTWGLVGLQFPKR